MKDLIEFPVIYTFKIVGDNITKFKKDIENIFLHYDDVIFKENKSSGGKFLSLSVTVELKSYDELESIYKKIASVENLRFHA